jgi:hypothetical protein
MSGGDDEDSDQNEESEEEIAAAADVWSRCMDLHFLRMPLN